MKKQNYKLTIVMIIVFVIVTFVWFGSFLLIRKIFGSPDNPGTVGDLFGAVGALFSGWAFVGVLWAILLQRKALQLQHEDLKATLDEMKQAREAHEESAETLRAQVVASNLQTRAQILTTFIQGVIGASTTAYRDSFREVGIFKQEEVSVVLKELLEINDSVKNNSR